MSGYSRISDESSSQQSARSMDEFSESNEGEKFGVMLGRSASSSSSSSQFQFQRAFSMRRSSSVSERYCRIHDQYTPPPIGSKKKQRGGGPNKILKACKRLLRL
ncbi:uncharacterized protein LOC114378961 [Glycine soja]|nr:uncharacterized protein LOC102666599 [Glycine max]XP_028193342.1 uncharacterized protein LOC114378961 [Glycine soja]|eukprot:XP_006592657.2 uncharacterized protein LOC102666599 [Glycine max]